MGLIWTETFESYAATADLSKKWANVGAGWTWANNIGRNGGPGISITAAAGGQGIITPNTVFPGTASGIFGLGFYIKFNNTTPTANAGFLNVIDSGGSLCGGLMFGTNRNIALQAANASIAASGTRAITDGNWHFIEWLFNLANANNPSKLFIDGTQEWSLASINMNNVGRFATAMSFARNNNGVNYSGISHLAVYNNSGNAPLANTDYPIGQWNMGVKRPNGDSAVQFTPDSGGNNFSRVNEVNADGDTSYVETAVSGNQDLYNMAGLSVVNTPTKIWGAMANYYIENPSGGTINFQGLCKSSGTTTTGTSTVCPTTYATLQQPFERDPNGGGVWSLSALDAATFGQKMV